MLLLNQPSPIIQTVTRFQDEVKITVDAQDKGAHFTFDFKRMIPGPQGMAAIPLDHISAMLIVLESAKTLIALGLGDPQSPLVLEAERLKLAAVEVLKAKQEAARVQNSQ